MKKLTIVLIICAWSGMAYAQYVAQSLQQRIQSDQTAITLDQTDIANKQADIDSIVNDVQANSVTANVPAVQAVEAQQIQQSQPAQENMVTQQVNAS